MLTESYIGSKLTYFEITCNTVLRWSSLILRYQKIPPVRNLSASSSQRAYTLYV